MIKKSILAFTFLTSTILASGDLTLPGERWVAQFNGYVCAAFTDFTPQPQSHQDISVEFETLTTDRTLDNALIKATFVEDGEVCRYSAILFADNAAFTSTLVDSKAYSTNGNSECLNGKALLDSQFQLNDYLYYGHPHNLSFMLPESDLSGICPAGATHIGANFVVKGIIK